MADVRMEEFGNMIPPLQLPIARASSAPCRRTPNRSPDAGYGLPGNLCGYRSIFMVTGDLPPFLQGPLPENHLESNSPEMHRGRDG